MHVWLMKGLDKNEQAILQIHHHFITKMIKFDTTEYSTVLKVVKSFWGTVRHVKNTVII